MPAPLGLVIGRNDRWPRTKETPLEGHRGSTRIFLLLLVSSPLSRFSFDWNHRGRAKDQDRAKFRKRFERNLRKKEEKYPRGEDFAKRRRINYTEYLIFLLLLSLSLSSFRLEWMVDTKDGGSRSRGKREEKKKLRNGNKVDKEESFCSSFASKKRRNSKDRESRSRKSLEQKKQNIFILVHYPRLFLYSFSLLD